MRNFPQAISAGMILLVGGLLFHSHRLSAQVVIEQSPAQAGHPKQIKYFSMEHRPADLISREDRQLIQTHQKELISEAHFYGYDITTSGWTYDQTICPQLPNTLLLHYLYKFPDDSESL